MKSIDLFKSVYSQKELIISMVKRDLQTRYAGSLLGLFWAIILPSVTIAVFWFVFTIGFKAKPNNGVPFVVWFSCGLAAWSLFSEIVNGSASLVVSNSNLVKKTLFSSEILSIIKIISSLFLHMIFLLILFGLILFQDVPFSLYYIQLLYYLFCLIVLSLGLSWIISAINVFIRDTNHFVSIVIQVGFWGTPIFWDPLTMPDKFQVLLRINPMFYVVQGYRDSILYNIPFWSHPGYTLYFWGVTLATLLLGAFLFTTLKPQFVDVL